MPYRAVLEFDANGRPFLSEAGIHHLVRVRRLGEGEMFLGLARNQAVWYRCRLGRQGGEWVVDIVTRIGTVGESSLEIVLGVALIKKARFEWMIQKACELGVSEIVPLTTGYVEESLARRAGKLLPRWQRILEESVKQCGRSRAPVMRSVNRLVEFLEFSSGALQIVLDPEADSNLREIKKEPGGIGSARIAVLTGPEGGWGVEERRLFEEHDIRPVFLGPRTLRSETAAVAAVALVQYLWGDLVSRPRDSHHFADGSCEERSRREEESMQ